MPSPVVVRVLLTPPALLTSTSRRSWRARNVSASWRIADCEAKSHMKSDTSAAPLRLFTSRAAASLRSGSRPTIATRAPRRARSIAAWRPIPLDAPVIRMVLPRTSQGIRLASLSSSGNHTVEGMIREWGVEVGKRTEDQRWKCLNCESVSTLINAAWEDADRGDIHDAGHNLEPQWLCLARRSSAIETK